MFTFQPTI